MNGGRRTTGTGREEFEALVIALEAAQDKVTGYARDGGYDANTMLELHAKRAKARAAVLAAFSAARGVDYAAARKELAAQLNELQEGDLALIDVFDVRRIVDAAFSAARGVDREAVKEAWAALLFDVDTMPVESMKVAVVEVRKLLDRALSGAGR